MKNLFLGTAVFLLAFSPVSLKARSPTDRRKGLPGGKTKMRRTYHCQAQRKQR